jgi:hypothetical protein
MHLFAYRTVAALTTAALLAAPVARAQSAPAAQAHPQPQIIYVQAPPPQPQTQPSYAQHPNGEYTAPLAQQTQIVYVPQSVAISGPRVINDYNEGEAVPPGYHPESRTRKGLIVGGAVMFGVLYLFSVLAAAVASDAAKTCNAIDTGCSSNNPDSALYIPVAGPFVQMAKTDSSTANFFLAVDGLGQAAGAAMLIYGLTSPRTVLVRNDLGTLQVVPMRMGKNGSGLGLAATF